ncbi:CotH kinase family protein [Butyrivibrio sp. MC2013]|uniref:CotH kinase family protein n=1 Tax=Butyrivibrio sp. MC2013 TaxID=1280686 RepID=UPI000421320D|nr:CotH kinase family protein [Butyrivibrio sp. MC2013]
MKKKADLSIVLILLAAVLMILCSRIYTEYISPQLMPEEETVENEAATEDTRARKKVQIGADHLRDNDTLYDYDETGVVCMYLTVRRGNGPENSDHSWEEINHYSAYDYDEMNVDRYKVEALLQVGDENGPKKGELGYGRTASNATVQIRGQTSTRYSQKNYKIKLDDNVGLWHDQKTIALNKHMAEGLRFRNMLGFSLLEDVPQLMSLRTNLVHLYVKDETSGSGEEALFEDYGLYTQIEQLNKRALQSHGLDKNGYLYKINFFEFFREEDIIKNLDDPDYDEDLFTDRMEIKGEKNNAKLIAMLDDVNDMSLDIETVIAKHFDRENLLYWLAFEILTGNIDTQSRNCYIYSPLNEDCWYFICWDNDDFFQFDEDEIRGNVDYAGWCRGVSNYWGNVLFSRCLKSEAFRTDLDKAIDDLRSGALSKENITKKVTKYREKVKPYVFTSPDVTYAPLTPERYDEVADALPDLVDFYYDNYLETLEAPMPFFIGVPTASGGKIHFAWDVSFDFAQQDVTYHMELSDDPYMNHVIERYDGIWPGYECEMPQGGKTYYVKVTAEDTDGNITEAFDYHVDINGNKCYGVKEFYIGTDNEIYEYERVE